MNTDTHGSTNQHHGGRPQGANAWRIAGWSLGASILLVPLIATLVTGGMRWDLADFVLAAVLVGAVGGAFEFAVRLTTNRAYRAAMALALGTGFILTWGNLAVGVIGSEDNPANRMYFGVLAVGIAGAILARLQPVGMSRALVATAVAQVMAALVAAVAGWGYAGPITVFFAVLWLASAWLFHKAAPRGEPAAA